MQIKEFEKKYCEKITRLAIESVRFFCAEDYDESQLNIWQKNLIPQILEDVQKIDTIGFVAVEGDDCCGVCFLDLDNGKVKGLYVHPDFAKQGIGTILMQKIESIAKDKGVKELILDASTNAIEFYEKIGYKRVCTSFCTVPEVPSTKMKKIL